MLSPKGIDREHAENITQRNQFSINVNRSFQRTEVNTME